MFERLRNILHDADVEFRVQYMIEVIFAIRKNGFKVSERASAFVLWDSVLLNSI